MKSVNIKLLGLNASVTPVVKINGEDTPLTKNQFGGYEVNYQTEDEEIEVQISRMFELKAKLWWLFMIISYIVSILGIFEPIYDKKSIDIIGKYRFKLNENNEIKFRFNPLAKQGKAIELESQCELLELENRYQVDKKVKTRKTVYLIIKILVWIAVAVLVGYFISR